MLPWRILNANIAVKVAKSHIQTMDTKGEVKKVIRDYGDVESYNRTVAFTMEEEGHSDSVVLADATFEMAEN